MEWYSAIKRNEVLIHAIAWMNLEKMLTRHRKTNVVLFHLHKVSGIAKFLETVE